jgi:tRNA 2-selenouridine synthase
MSQSLIAEDFLSLYKVSKPLLIDTRSEGEFARGHIPGAINIPLLNNEQRAVVGTTYKKKGRQEAVLKGFELAGPLFHKMILKVSKLSDAPEVMVYCWRGGMRSAVFCWMLNLAGYKTTVLKGGYKKYRSWCQEQFSRPYNIVVLGGKTGSGKTEMLHYLKQQGQQTICMETIASHRGSSFGALGQQPQPTQEHFENMLGFELHDIKKEAPVWLENESRNVGSIKIPDVLFERMRTSKVVEMQVARKIRIMRILKEYGAFSKEMLAENTMKLERRMGGQNVREAVKMLFNDDYDGWLNLLLEYYDRTYDYSNTQRGESLKALVEIKWQKPEEEVLALINLI